MPAETLRALYDAAVRRDGEAMAQCYAPDAIFQDEVFRLAGRNVGDMWRMLMGRSTDLRVSYEVLGEDRATWTADYTFEGNPVHNEISSSFTFAPDGKIATQVDRFSFPKWAGQALGLPGKLLGRFGFFHDAVRKRTAGVLADWQAKRDAP
jgi:hypothetical protein